MPPLLPLRRGRNAVDGIGPKPLCRDVRVCKADGGFAIGHGVNGFKEGAAVRHDGHIAGAQMFARAVLDAPHAFAGPLVMAVDVVLAHTEVGTGGLLFGVVAPLVVFAHIGYVIWQADEARALVTHGVFADGVIEAGEDRDPIGVLVVHRHMHLCDGHGL